MGFCEHGAILGKGTRHMGIHMASSQTETKIPTAREIARNAPYETTSREQSREKVPDPLRDRARHLV